MNAQPVMSSVEWLETTEVDKSFTHDVPLVPVKAEQASLDVLVENATDQLFDYEPPHTFAMFPVCNGNIRRSFQRSVLESVNVDQALEVLDRLDVEGGEKIFEMLYMLNDLNDLSEVIYLKILSTLKP